MQSVDFRCNASFLEVSPLRAAPRSPRLSKYSDEKNWQIVQLILNHC